MTTLQPIQPASMPKVPAPSTQLQQDAATKAASLVQQGKATQALQDAIPNASEDTLKQIIAGNVPQQYQPPTAPAAKIVTPDGSSVQTQPTVKTTRTLAEATQLASGAAQPYGDQNAYRLVYLPTGEVRWVVGEGAINLLKSTQYDIATNAQAQASAYAQGKYKFSVSGFTSDMPEYQQAEASLKQAGVSAPSGQDVNDYLAGKSLTIANGKVYTDPDQPIRELLQANGIANPNAYDIAKAKSLDSFVVQNGNVMSQDEAQNLYDDQTRQALQTAGISDPTTAQIKLAQSNPNIQVFNGDIYDSKEAAEFAAAKANLKDAGIANPTPQQIDVLRNNPKTAVVAYGTVFANKDEVPSTVAYPAAELPTVDLSKFKGSNDTYDIASALQSGITEQQLVDAGFSKADVDDKLKFLNDNVQAGDGQWIARDEYDKLSASQQSTLLKEGFDALQQSTDRSTAASNFIEAAGGPVAALQKGVIGESELKAAGYSTDDIDVIKAEAAGTSPSSTRLTADQERFKEELDKRVETPSYTPEQERFLQELNAPANAKQAAIITNPYRLDSFEGKVYTQAFVNSFDTISDKNATDKEKATVWNKNYQDAFNQNLKSLSEKDALVQALKMVGHMADPRNIDPKDLIPIYGTKRAIDKLSSEWDTLTGEQKILGSLSAGVSAAGDALIFVPVAKGVGSELKVALRGTSTDAGFTSRVVSDEGKATVINALEAKQKEIPIEVSPNPKVIQAARDAVTSISDYKPESKIVGVATKAADIQNAGVRLIEVTPAIAKQVAKLPEASIRQISNIKPATFNAIKALDDKTIAAIEATPVKTRQVISGVSASAVKQIKSLDAKAITAIEATPAKAHEFIAAAQQQVKALDAKAISAIEATPAKTREAIKTISTVPGKASAAYAASDLSPALSKTAVGAASTINRSGAAILRAPSEAVQSLAGTKKPTAVFELRSFNDASVRAAQSLISEANKKGVPTELRVIIRQNTDKAVLDDIADSISKARPKKVTIIGEQSNKALTIKDIAENKAEPMRRTTFTPEQLAKFKKQGFDITASTPAGPLKAEQKAPIPKPTSLSVNEATAYLDSLSKRYIPRTTKKEVVLKPPDSMADFRKAKVEYGIGETEQSGGKGRAPLSKNPPRGSGGGIGTPVKEAPEVEARRTARIYGSRDTAPALPLIGHPLSPGFIPIPPVPETPNKQPIEPGRRTPSRPDQKPNRPIGPKVPSEPYKAPSPGRGPSPVTPIKPKPGEGTPTHNPSPIHNPNRINVPSPDKITPNTPKRVQITPSHTPTTPREDKPYRRVNIPGDIKTIVPTTGPGPLTKPNTHTPPGPQPSPPPPSPDKKEAKPKLQERFRINMPKQSEDQVLPSGQFPKKVRFAYGLFDTELNLFTREIKNFPRQTAASPYKTFKVVETSSQRPPASVFKLRGFERFQVTPDNISFIYNPRKLFVSTPKPVRGDRFIGSDRFIARHNAFKQRF